jgi:DNA primase
MAERIPDEVLSEIRARTSIVEVISAHIALRKAGRSYTGLCPFHNESTPSFSVNEEGGFFHCFGCGVGGNAFTFLTRVEGISFPEAVRRLAAKAGVALPQTAKDPQAQERMHLFRLNDLAATYFQRCLWGNLGDFARRYLEERGLNRAIAEQFRLGFAPSGREGLARFLAAQRVDLEKAAELGLVGNGEDGRFYDKFRHRLIFPITDIVGRIVGFGGRLLPMPQDVNTAKRYTLPKYLNSPDSVLYKKGTLLYGLSQAKEAIQQRGRAILVEGYIDLLALVQYGQTEAVAVLGTALSAEQLKLLRRAAGSGEAYMFFDGDEAGRRAATRAFPLCIEADMPGRGVFLPQGEDPDTFVRKYGTEALNQLIAQAKPLEDFYFERHAPPPGASTSQRVQAAKEAMAILNTVHDPVTRGALLTQIAQRFAVNEEELRGMATAADAPRPPTRQPIPQPQMAERLTGQAATEAELIQLMLLDRNLASSVAEEDIIPSFQYWGALANEIIEAWRQSDRIDLSTFLDKLPRKVADSVSRTYGRSEGEEEKAARHHLLFDCVMKIRSAQRKSGKERVLQEIREAERRGDDEAVRSGLQRLQQWDG